MEFFCSEHYFYIFFQIESKVALLGSKANNLLSVQPLYSKTFICQMGVFCFILAKGDSLLSGGVHIFLQNKTLFITLFS